MLSCQNAPRVETDAVIFSIECLFPVIYRLLGLVRVTRPCTCAGVREANPDQADVISRILKGSSILVVCPEILESLYLLRSSLCAAILARVDVYIPSIQIILLTPTDNLAKTLYRLLKGYARFCLKIRAKMCLEDASAASDEGFQSPRKSAGSRTVGEHILVGTP